MRAAEALHRARRDGQARDLAEIGHGRAVLGGHPLVAISLVSALRQRGGARVGRAPPGTHARRHASAACDFFEDRQEV